MKRFLFLVLTVALAAACSGCVTLLIGAAAGATSVVWYNGEAQSTYDASMDKTWAACEKTFAELNITVTQNDGKDDQLTRVLVGRTQNDEKVKIHLKSLSDSSTKVGVRIGIFGDKDMSARIHGEIRKQLGIQSN